MDIIYILCIHVNRYLDKMSKNSKNLIEKHIYLPKEDWEMAKKYGKRFNEGASYYIRKWVREGIERERLEK